jgi:serine-type D-Ala-D-Ala carboxypeptidase/endopeptidase
MASYLVTLLLALTPVQQAPPQTPSASASDAAAALDRYVGRYQFTPAAIMTVSRDGAHLMVQLPGQSRVEIIPDGDNEFFLQVIDAQISFEMDDNDRAIALVLHQLGRDQRAPRIDVEPPRPSAGAAAKEVTVPPEVFDRHVGEYEFGPTAVITISREGTHFYEQLTGQSRFEIFAMNEREYFLKVVDAQITFDVDSQMRTTALVLHQGGREIRAVKSP